MLQFFPSLRFGFKHIGDQELTSIENLWQLNETNKLFKCKFHTRLPRTFDLHFPNVYTRTRSYMMSY